MNLWEQVKNELVTRLPASTVTLWIEPLQCGRCDDETLELYGPDTFFCSWVMEHYQKQIKEVLAALGQHQLGIRLLPAPAEATNQHNVAPRESKGEQLRLPAMPMRQATIRTLHPRYTFDEFMVGESNALAQSACLALANGDSAMGSCLFIEAETGLGKSHLTHAVAHHIYNNFPGTRLHYLTGLQLTSEMVRAIRNNTMDGFKEKYHNQCDVLLMEDVHSLAGKLKTQEELSAALDILMETGKRIIFTGKSAPRDIPNIDVSFRSRLTSGLITSINPPDFRTKVLIIRRKAINKNLALSDDLISYMAENIKGDIRQIESAVVGLKAKASLLKTSPDLDMVKEVITNIIGRYQELSVEMIRDFLAHQFKVSVEEMQSKSRKKSVAFPRQISMYLARKLTNQGLADIGKAFNRDHSTVVHSIRVITDAIVRNGSIRGQVDHLSEKIRKKYL